MAPGKTWYDVLGVLAGAGPVAVPDVRGLFYYVALEAATRRGLHVSIVRLTERPMAVDGLVVDQDPRPPTKAYRGAKLTVQLWHPPAWSR
jgi:beta-lactam-binding protein with PASTA domain